MARPERACKVNGMSNRIATITITTNTRRDVDAVACATLNVAGRQRVNHPATEDALQAWVDSATTAAMKAGILVHIRDERVAR